MISCFSLPAIAADPCSYQYGPPRLLLTIQTACQNKEKTIPGEKKNIPKLQSFFFLFSN